MKLGIVTAYPPSKITLTEYAFHLVKHFRTHQQVSELIVYTDRTQSYEPIEANILGCAVKFMPCWEFNSIKNVLDIKKAIKATQPDAVLYNLQFMKFGDKKIPAALGLFSPWMTRLMKIPTIVLLHNIMETVDLASAGFTKNKLKQRVFGFIGTVLTRIILKADKVAVTIGAYADTLESKYNAKNVCVIPHGTFDTPPMPRFESKMDSFNIMTFGKFGTYKKVEQLIEAVIQLRTISKKKISLTIAGTDNPNALGYLDGVAQKYSHVSDLNFTGYVEEEDVPVIFGESDVVVFPYTSTTGSSGVLHQAGSFGKAVVMPNIGDLAHLVEDEGYCGEYFNPTDINSLVNAIKALIVNDSYRMAMAKKNYKAAAALSMTQITAKYLEQFELLRLRTTADISPLYL